jgi:hypothetical protein
MQLDVVLSKRIPFHIEEVGKECMCVVLMLDIVIWIVRAHNLIMQIKSDFRIAVV